MLGDVATWCGFELPRNISRVAYDLYLDPRSGEEKWICVWSTRDGQEHKTEFGEDVPVHERIIATIVAMRMQHGNDSEGEGSSPSKTA